MRKEACLTWRCVVPFWNGVRLVMWGIIDIEVLTLFELFPVFTLVLAEKITYDNVYDARDLKQSS